MNYDTKQLYIYGEMLLSHVQELFQKHYPLLRLEFYKNPHVIGAASPKKDKFPCTLKVDEVRIMRTSGWVDISKNVLVADLEKAFSRKLGLNVQVHRLFRDKWIVTTHTDDWSLEAQQETARI